MADTVVSPNNVPVVYRRRPDRERTMPAVSKAQNRAMHAAAAGNSTLGIPQSVGQEFTADQALGSVKNLPARKHVKKLMRRGSVSEKAAARHLSKYGNENNIDASSR